MDYGEGTGKKGVIKGWSGGGRNVQRMTLQRKSAIPELEDNGDLLLDRHHHFSPYSRLYEL
jgi:hypothetical protein